jgi:hypothetical protein
VAREALLLIGVAAAVVFHVVLVIEGARLVTNSSAVPK